jgi:CRISPR-associated endonuclease/helicase Cas3
MLAVIEDETGAGKTEAALLLAHRMLQAGKARGVFFALPTMATSDAMFARAQSIVPQMMQSPTLTLAHGRAGLSDAFRDLARSEHNGEDTATCTAWLRDSRRRALLADVGIGTIDQALLSVLPVKHQTLRHYGLSSKILIVDEVHEMGEPYIGQELVRLLEMHRAAGGSAILLTATLPLDLRARLLATYDGENSATAYPALSIAGGQVITQFAPDTRPVKGPVHVARLGHVDDALDLLTQSTQKGAACVWVRNAVDDAIAAVAALQSRGIAARLLHARFALCDRKRIEAEVLSRVGKDGTGRAGFVLVGTQVLEASLDLDFDVMVSDIAPIASLVQRAGRLWRHMDRRPAAARPVSHPVLHILSPDPDHIADENWLKGALGSGAYVYSLPDIWRSARVVFDAGKITAPHGLRALIEAVHGPDAYPLPTALEASDLRATGKAAGARTLALHNLVDLSRGYREAGRGDSDLSYPTRLGGEQRVLVLARMLDGGLRPWAGGDGSFADWALSEVSARRSRVDKLPLPDQSSPAIRNVTADWPDWRRAEVVVCPVAEDGLICEGLKYGAEYGLVFSPSEALG